MLSNVFDRSSQLTPQNLKQRQAKYGPQTRPGPPDSFIWPMGSCLLIHHIQPGVGCPACACMGPSPTHCCGDSAHCAPTIARKMALSPSLQVGKQQQSGGRAGVVVGRWVSRERQWWQVGRQAGSGNGAGGSGGGGMWGGVAVVMAVGGERAGEWQQQESRK